MSDLSDEKDLSQRCVLGEYLGRGTFIGRWHDLSLAPSCQAARPGRDFEILGIGDESSSVEFTYWDPGPSLALSSPRTS